MQTCEALAELGHSVTLLAGRKFWRGFPSRSQTFNYYGIPQRFELRRACDVPVSEGLFNRSAIKLTHAQSALLYTRSTRLAVLAAQQGVDVILELHHLPSPAQLQGVAEALSLPVFRRLVAITDGLAADLKRSLSGTDIASKLLVAADAVNPERFRPASRGDVHQQNVTCGYIGSFGTGKGVELLIPLARAMPDTSFQCYGGTTSQLKLKHQQAALPENLYCHGRIRPPEVPLALRKFDIALLPNQPSVILDNGVDIGRYTSPMKLFEYMASGKAIVASDLPVLREVLTDEVNALLVPHDDVAAWQVAIERLSTDSSLAVRLSRQAVKDAKSRYSYHTRMRNVLSGDESNDVEATIALRESVLRISA